MSEREELAKWCDKIVELYPGEERYRRIAALLRQPPAPVQVTGDMVERADEAYHKTVGGMIEGRPMKNALSAALQAGVPTGYTATNTSELRMSAQHMLETALKSCGDKGGFAISAQWAKDILFLLNQPLPAAPAPGEGR